MNIGITQRQAFSHLLKGTKIRRKRWPDDNWIQYLRTGNQCELHTYWTGPAQDNESIAIHVLHGLLAWDDWEVVE